MRIHGSRTKGQNINQKLQKENLLLTQIWTVKNEFFKKKSDH